MNSLNDFFDALGNVKIGEEVSLVTNASAYMITTVESPENFVDRIAFWKDGRGYLGVVPSSIKSDFKEGQENLGKVLSWVSLLFYWLFTINLAVGMFNMLPLGPIDGGKMFLIVSNSVVKNEKKARKIWMFVSFFCLALILIGLMPFILKLLNFMFSPVIGLFF